MEDLFFAIANAQHPVKAASKPSEVAASTAKASSTSSSTDLSTNPFGSAATTNFRSEPQQQQQQQLQNSNFFGAFAAYTSGSESKGDFNTTSVNFTNILGAAFFAQK